jgi:hypothetical protein
MTGMIRKATILVALGLVAATAATAGTPNPLNCSFPTFIKVVGSLPGTPLGAVASRATFMADGIPDPAGLFTVTIRDDGNLPIQGNAVELNFTNCTDMRLCLRAGVTCATATVMAVTDVNGVATFNIVGGGVNIGGTLPVVPVACVSITAGGGVYLGTARVNVYNQNGAISLDGVNILDMSVPCRPGQGFVCESLGL